MKIIAKPLFLPNTAGALSAARVGPVSMPPPGTMAAKHPVTTIANDEIPRTAPSLGRMKGVLTATVPAVFGSSCVTPSTIGYGIAAAALALGALYLLIRSIGNRGAATVMNDAAFEELRESFRKEELALAVDSLSTTVEELKRLLQLDSHDAAQFFSSPQLYRSYAVALGQARSLCLDGARAALERVRTTSQQPVDAMRAGFDEIVECARTYWTTRTRLQQEILMLVTDPDTAASLERIRQWSAHDEKRHTQFNEMLLRSRPRTPHDFS